MYSMSERKVSECKNRKADNVFKKYGGTREQDEKRWYEDGEKIWRMSELAQ